MYGSRCLHLQSINFICVKSFNLKAGNNISVKPGSTAAHKFDLSLKKCSNSNWETQSYNLINWRYCNIDDSAVTSKIDTIKDFFCLSWAWNHICIYILEISSFLLNHAIVTPTKTMNILKDCKILIFKVTF